MDIFTYKIIYYVLILFLGFFLGYIIKKDNYEKSIQDEVFKAEKEYQNSGKRLEKIKEDYIETENRIQINRDLHKTQKDVVDKIKSQINALQQKIITSQNAFDDLKTKYEGILEDIKDFEKKIKNIKGEYQEISNIFEENEKLIVKKELLQDRYKKLTDQLAKLKNKKDVLQNNFNKFKLYKENLIKKEDSISERLNLILKKNEIGRYENEKELSQIAKSLKVKVLNYRYKFEELKQKLSYGKKIDKKDIDDFISKNGKERFVDKFLAKLFNINQKGDK
jgi:chromosome segregation ATPase